MLSVVAVRRGKSHGINLLILTVGLHLNTALGLIPRFSPENISQYAYSLGSYIHYPRRDGQAKSAYGQYVILFAVNSCQYLFICCS